MPTKKPKGKERKVKAWVVIDEPSGVIQILGRYGMAITQSEEQIVLGWQKDFKATKLFYVPCTIHYSLLHSPKKKSNKTKP